MATYAEIECEYVESELERFLEAFPDVEDIEQGVAKRILRLMLLEAYRAGYYHRERN